MWDWGYNVQTGPEVLKDSEWAARSSADTSWTKRIHLLQGDTCLQLETHTKTWLSVLWSTANFVSMIFNNQRCTQKVCILCLILWRTTKMPRWVVQLQGDQGCQLYLLLIFSSSVCIEAATSNESWKIFESLAFSSHSLAPHFRAKQNELTARS